MSPNASEREQKVALKNNKKSRLPGEKSGNAPFKARLAGKGGQQVLGAGRRKVIQQHFGENRVCRYPKRWEKRVKPQKG